MRCIYCDIYDHGDQVEILDSGIVGTVVGTIIVAGDEPRYKVEYIDTHGNPQFREWRASQLEPWNESDDSDDGIPSVETEVPDRIFYELARPARSNVIRFPIERTRGPNRRAA